MADRFDKFTERARTVLQLAQEEARRLNHNYIGTEHLLLGLVREGEGVAAKILANLGVELNKVRSAVEFVIGRGDRKVTGDIGLTPRAKKMIELSVDEARRLNSDHIGTEHLLLALVREGGGIAACILESLDAPLDNVRGEVIYYLSRTGAGRQPHPAGPTPAVDRLGLDLSSIEETLAILKVLRNRYETHHHVPIGDEALRAAVELSDLYIIDRSLLEWAADVLDDAAALVRSRTGGAPLDYRAMLRNLEDVQREIDAAILAQQFELAAEHYEHLKKLREEISAIETGWLTDPISGRPVVAIADVVEAVSARTGIAASSIAARYRDLRAPDSRQD